MHLGALKHSHGVSEEGEGSGLVNNPRTTTARATTDKKSNLTTGTIARRKESGVSTKMRVKYAVTVAERYFSSLSFVLLQLKLLVT